MNPPSEKQSHVIWLAATGMAIATLAALIVALIWGLGKVLQILSPVIWPLAIAGVIVYLLDPLVDFFEKRGLSRLKAVICVFATAILLFAAILGAIVPQIFTETQQLVSQVPQMATNVEDHVERWLEHPPPLIERILRHATAPENPAAPTTTNAPPAQSDQTNAPASTNAAAGATGNATANQKAIDSAVAKALPQISSWLGVQVKRVGTWIEFLIGLVLVPVYVFYLLREKRSIESSWTDYLPVADSKFKDELVFVLSAINGYLVVFFRGQVLVAMCNAVLYTIGFLLIGLPYAVLLGATALLFTIIPFIGAITLSVIALAIAIAKFGDSTHPLLVLLVFVVVQTTENAVYSPRIMHGRVGLHPLTIIIAVMVGTTLLGGLLGGILAIPLTAVIRVLLSRYVWKRRAV
jgi:predicted PurR-regulated permease PerM